MIAVTRFYLKLPECERFFCLCFSVLSRNIFKYFWMHKFLLVLSTNLSKPGAIFPCVKIKKIKTGFSITIDFLLLFGYKCLEIYTYFFIATKFIQTKFSKAFIFFLLFLLLLQISSIELAKASLILLFTPACSFSQSH